MLCLRPISLPEYINYDTGEITGGRNVPCGKCLACLTRRRSHWTIRLLYELKNADSATFLTLTYNDENLPKNGKLDKKQLQKYFKRVRSKSPKLKYFAVGEYGDKGKRPHYHAIVYNADNEVLQDKWTNKGQDIGRISCDNVEEASIHYVTKYIINENNSPGLSPIRISSKGLGENYARTYRNYHRCNSSLEYTSRVGKKNSLPRYISEKIFNNSFIEVEKEKSVKQKDGSYKIINYKSKQYEKDISYYTALDLNKEWIKKQEKEYFGEKRIVRDNAIKSRKDKAKKQSKSKDV